MTINLRLEIKELDSFRGRYWSQLRLLFIIYHHYSDLGYYREVAKRAPNFLGVII